MNERIAAPPIEWDGVVAPEPEAVRFRRLTISGVWDNERSTFLSTRVRFGIIGEELVTPLRPDGGGPAVLVNRGWYPLSERERVLAELLAEPRGPVSSPAGSEVSGLARLLTGAPARRTPAGAWSWFDVASMAPGVPYEVVPWLLVQGTLVGDPSDDTGLDRALPLQTFTAFSADTPHLAYATTWYGLAVALLATAAIRLRGERRGDATVDQRSRTEPHRAR